MSQSLPYWAIKDMIIVPASERGQAKLDWFIHSKPARYGRVNFIDREIIHVVIYAGNGEPVGSSNFWFKYDNWSEADWKPVDPKSMMGKVATAWARLGEILED